MGDNVIITREERLNNPVKAELFHRLTNIIGHIRHRCTNPNNEEYKNYGARGVTYSSKWKTTKGFIDDVDGIPGWDEKLFLEKKLQLDKDIRVPGNKVYSKETCMWVTHKINMQVLPSRQREFYGYQEDTQQIVKYSSISLISNDLGLNPTVVSNVLHHIKHRAKGWYLWYCSEPSPKVIRYWIIREDGKSFYGNNRSQVSRRAGYAENYFQYKTKGGKFGYPLVRKNEVFNLTEIDLNSLIRKYERSND